MPSNPKQFFELASSISSIVEDLNKLGISVKVGNDFSVYREYRSHLSERGPVYPMFDARSSYIDHTNGFWICGFDNDARLIHTQAARLIDLSNRTLGEHITIHRQKYATPNKSSDPDKTFFVGPKALGRITGRVCYQGEFWLHAQGLGGPRSLGATPLLSSLLLEIAAASWKPSSFFALVPKKLAAKGAHLRYGYHHCEPGQWLGPNREVTDEDYLIWMDADEFESDSGSILASSFADMGLLEAPLVQCTNYQRPQLVLAGE
ncbi:hypothetical protein V8J82_14185 [Gymnodinialimonas sp. 2305UL16-5]|uniref:hypothetical protein n=1 Tax=Gymnodinialimonas mytili TaxID=3126503 RepID=UPI00309A4576